MRLIVADLGAYSHFVSREFAYIMRELIAAHGWQHLEPSALWGGAMREEIVRHCGELPEVILFWCGHVFLCTHERELKKLNTAKWFVADDLHHLGTMALQEKAFRLCDTVLSTYAYRFEEFFPKVAKSRRIVWLPHSASPDFTLAANSAPRNKFFLSGAITEHYPLRERLNALKESGFKKIIRHEHPGYHCEYNYTDDGRVGRAFARRIWEHRAAFTDCSLYRYAVAKHFEIPATGALLVADIALEEPLKQLGFFPGVHYFPVSDRDLEERVRFLFREEHRAESDQIRQNGRALVLARHRTSHRARLINELPIS
ncbi:MAG TPA: glycosyltransferase [Chthoniobacterales bacterium]|nr:glycosyltransferase [Chthoniobacterales bacterium]